MNETETILKNAMVLANNRAMKTTTIGMLNVFKSHNIIDSFVFQENDDLTIVSDDEKLMTLIFKNDEDLREYVVLNYPDCVDEIDKLYDEYTYLISKELKRIFGNNIKTISEIRNLSDT